MDVDDLPSPRLDPMSLIAFNMADRFCSAMFFLFLSSIAGRQVRHLNTNIWVYGRSILQRDGGFVL